MDYPLAITRTAPWDDVQAEEPPKQDDGGKELVAPVTHSVGSGLALAMPKVAPTCGFKRFCIYVGDDKASQSLSSSKGNAKVPVNGLPFAFAPGVDDARVGWDLSIPFDVTSMKVELLRRDGKAVKLLHPEYGANDLGFLTECPAEKPWKMNGTIGFDYFVAIDDPDFPMGLPTVEHSPYRLKVTITSKEAGYPLVAWTYFHVLVEQLELSWVDDPRLVLPLAKADRAKHLETYKRLKDAKNALKGQVPTGDEAAQVLLDANLFYQGDSDLTGKNNAFFKRLHALWGDGPQVPLLVRPKVRSAAGEAVDAPGAIGKVRYLWDWVDRTGDDQEVAPLGEPKAEDTEAKVQNFVSLVQALEMEESDDAPGGWSCHVSRGGKRGAGAAPVFPPQAGAEPADALPDPGDGAATFPFKVTACADRKWAAISEGWAKGALAGASGVIFQPSRMAGDAYSVNVLLIAGEDADAVQGARDVESYPPALVAKSGRFVVWHQVRMVKHLKVGTVKSVDMAKVKSEFARTYVHLDYDPKDVVDATQRLKEVLQDVYGGALRERLPEYVQDALPTASTGSKEGLVEFREYAVFKEAWQKRHNGVSSAYAESRKLKNPKTQSGDERPSWFVRGTSGRHPFLEPWPVEFERVELDVDGKVDVEFVDPFGREHSDEYENKKRKYTVQFETGKRVIKAKNKELTAEQLRMLAVIYTAASTDPDTGNEAVYDPARHQPIKVKLTGKTTKEGNKERLTNLEAAIRDIVEQRWHHCSETQDSFPKVKDGELTGQSCNQRTYESAAAYEWVWQVLELATFEAFDAGPGLYFLQLGEKACQFRGPKGKALYGDDQDRIIANIGADAAEPTFKHEIGHARFVNHTYVSQKTSDPLRLHQADACAGCIMIAVGTRPEMVFCGVCRLRMRGWSIFKVTDPVAGTWDDQVKVLNEDGAPEGPIPPPPE